MKRITVHIDRLVLRGFDDKDRDSLAEGVRLELGNLLANAGASQSLTGIHSIPRLRVGSVQIGQGAKPAQVGKLIASGIVRGRRR